MKNIIALSFLILLTSCSKVNQVTPLSYEEVSSIGSLDELNLKEYLSLVSSIDVVAEIVNNQDSLVRIFAPLINQGIRKKLLPISDFKFIKSFTPSNIDYLMRMSSSKQPAITSFVTTAPYASDSLSTIGSQSLFLLSIYKGEKYMTSNGELLKYQFEISNSYKSWWENNY